MLTSFIYSITCRIPSPAKNHTGEMPAKYMTLWRNAANSFQSTAYVSIVRGRGTEKISAVQGAVTSAKQGIIPVCAIESQKTKPMTMKKL